MPYRFTFDLSKIPRFLFTEIAKAGYQVSVHEKVGKRAQDLIQKFKIDEATGLNLSDAAVLLQDLIDMQAKNIAEKKDFASAKKRALFLPHCSRKHMDDHCKAVFNPDVPSYTCSHCSPDCLVNRASNFAAKRGYDVYVLPGGSCIPKILKLKGYEGVVGVACGEELKLGGGVAKGMGVAGQTVPLIKNGCANTVFSIETLFRTLDTK